VRLWISEGRLNAQSQAKLEGEAAFRPLGTFPEFGPLLAGALGGALTGQAVAGGSDWAEGDYVLDIGHCCSRAWRAFQANLGTLVGATVLYFLVIFSFAAVAGMLSTLVAGKEVSANAVSLILRTLVQSVVGSLVLGPMTGGFYLVVLRVLRQQPTGVGDLFWGFQNRFSRLYLVQLIISLISATCFLPFSVVLLGKLAPVLVKFQQSPTPDQVSGLMQQMMGAYESALPILLACLIPSLFFQICLMFTLPGVVDTDQTLGAALASSWRTALRRFLPLLGLVFISGLVMLAGFMLCCVGGLFSFPLGTAMLLAAYESAYYRR
jgi:hypothetical protein